MCPWVGAADENFIFNSGRFLIVLHAVTVPLGYLIDCSIRISQSCVYNFVGEFSYKEC